jgi:hypothetical protein
MTDLLFAESPGGGTAIECDIITGAEFEKSWLVTEHPVETGSKVSDHRINQNAHFKVTIKQSESPIQKMKSRSSRTLTRPRTSWRPSGLLAAVEAVSGAVGSLLGAATGGDSKINVRTWDPYSGPSLPDLLEDDLTDIGNKGSLCTITVKGKTRSNLELVRISRSEQRGHSVFDLEFSERVTVSTGIATGLPRPASLKPPVKKGLVKTPEATAAEKGDAKESLLSKGLTFAGM